MEGEKCSWCGADLKDRAMYECCRRCLKPFLCAKCGQSREDLDKSFCDKCDEDGEDGM